MNRGRPCRLNSLLGTPPPLDFSRITVMVILINIIIISIIITMIVITIIIIVII